MHILVPTTKLQMAQLLTDQANAPFNVFLDRAGGRTCFQETHKRRIQVLVPRGVWL